MPFIPSSVCKNEILEHFDLMECNIHNFQPKEKECALIIGSGSNYSANHIDVIAHQLLFFSFVQIIFVSKTKPMDV